MGGYQVESGTVPTSGGERFLIGNMNNFSIIVQLRRGTQLNSCELRKGEEQIFFYFFGMIDRHGRWKVLGLGSRSLHE